MLRDEHFSLKEHYEILREQYKLNNFLFEYMDGITSSLFGDLVNKLQADKIKLKKLNDLKNRFLGMAAHDLRNPLMVIAGYSQMLAEGGFGEINEEAADAAKKISITAESMFSITRNFLDYAKIESGEIDLRIEEFDAAEFIQSKIDYFNEIAKRKQQKIEFKQKMQNGIIKNDKSLIDQIVTNLISNAVKYSPLKSKISIALSADDEFMIFKVKDSGPGFTPEQRKKLFKSYSKVGNLPTGGEKSTGLGLYIVKTLVQRLGGNIRVLSKAGEGATFIVKVKRDV